MENPALRQKLEAARRFYGSGPAQDAALDLQAAIVAEIEKLGNPSGLEIDMKIFKGRVSSLENKVQSLEKRNDFGKGKR